MASRVQFLIGAKVTMNDKEDTSVVPQVSSYSLA